MIMITGVGTMIELSDGSTIYVAEVMNAAGNGTTIPITEKAYNILVAMSAAGEQETREPYDEDADADDNESTPAPTPGRPAAGDGDGDEDGVPQI